jgi:glutathione reductase (NADPH)
MQKQPSYVTENGKENASSRSLEADMVVHGAGRVPNLEGLNLVAGKVKYTSRGIQVNEYLQSVSNPAVYAAGDVAASGGAPLTPAAS